MATVLYSAPKTNINPLGIHTLPKGLKRCTMALQSLTEVYIKYGDVSNTFEIQLFICVFDLYKSLPLIQSPIQPLQYH